MSRIDQVLIFSTVWPEPSSSAAGVRQMQWVDFFREMGAEVILSSPAKEKNEQDWGKLSLPPGVRCLPLPLNDSRIKEVLSALKPDVVMFDRFILEEQFGHVIYEVYPDALVVLETQDLHLVRRARESVREEGWSTMAIASSVFSISSSSPPALSVPVDFYRTETALRETASISRVDYSFVISSFEEDLLKKEFGIGEEKQKWIPFYYPEIVSDDFSRAFESRNGFSWIGNFRHGPNVDGLRWFRKEVWPRLKRDLPSAVMHVYGAYPSEEVMSWNKPEIGFFVKGSAQNLSEVFLKARVNLAPLRFGAGVKGKIIEGWRFGVPCVTTTIGAEGLLPMNAALGAFPGLVANDPLGFVSACVQMHQDENLWKSHHEKAAQVLTTVFSRARVAGEMKLVFEKLMLAKREKTLPRWESKILRHELFNSHKYFARWIEAKTRPAQDQKS